MFSRGVETLRIDGHLTLTLLRHRNLAVFHDEACGLEVQSMTRAHPRREKCYYKCAAGLKTLPVEYILTQNRHFTGKKTNPKTKQQVKQVKGAYPKFWNLSLLEKKAREALKIPTWMEAFDLMRKKLEMILDRDVLPATLSKSPTVSRMTFGMNNSLLVPSKQAREVVEQQQRVLTQGWDPLFVGYSAAAYFNLSEIKISSWTTEAKKMGLNAAEVRCS